MKRNFKWATYIFTGSLLITLLAACGHRYHNPEDRADWAVDKTTEKLSLDETQVAKLNVLKDTLLSARKDFVTRRDNSRNDLKALIAQPTLDRGLALGMVSEHTNAVNAEAPRIIAALGDFYDSLNPEQQAQVREFMEDRLEHGHRSWH